MSDRSDFEYRYAKLVQEQRQQMQEKRGNGILIAIGIIFLGLILWSAFEARFEVPKNDFRHCYDADPTYHTYIECD